MARLTHNKKRNTGLVYELLVRAVSDAVVDRDHRRAAAILAIVERHFAPGTLLREEVDLHQSVMESRGVSERVARRIVDELKAAGIRLRGRDRDRARTNLIHEVNRVLGTGTFDMRVADYVAHASIGLILARSLGGRLDEGPDYARVEEALVHFLMESPGMGQHLDPDESRFAYDVARRLYAENYGKELDGMQSELLREFMRWQLGGPSAPLERMMERHRGMILDALREHRTDEEFTQDPEMGARLVEAIVSLEHSPPPADEGGLERLMLFHDLRREVLS